MNLVRYLGWRIVQGIFVVLGAVVVSFLITNLAGNPSDVIGGGLLTPAQRAQIGHQLGYDRPVLVRLGDYVTGVLHGDFGSSWRTGQSALGLVLKALPNTLILIACAMTLALLLAVPIALYSVLRRETRVDRSARATMMLVAALPDFWIALLLVLLLSVNLGALPSIGFDSPRSLIMPALAIGLPLIPTSVRLLRAALLDVVSQDFITTLRAKGLGEGTIVTRYALKHAAGPFVTLLAMQVGWLLGGTIIVEVIFAWPGMGSLLQDAVTNHDIAVIQAAVVIVATGYVLLNLAGDVLIALMDPRIRVGAR
ncbi:MAG TPA: ABC transporter permease [Conexibacter sp.]|jgi:ABC-type dipeptide/oligopeptide/nickel transport system permease component|nr:ABC transporter permease [Conexibacter sp.]